jgi:hypothetical protein
MESVEWSGFCEWKKSEWKKRKLLHFFVNVTVVGSYGNS